MASVEMIVKGADGNLVKQPIAAPVGSVIAFAADSVPAHCLACSGAAISRTAYPELFAVIGTTYGAGDGSTTFNLPNADGVLYGTASGRAVGTQLVEGLPNITGNLNAFYTYGNSTANDTTWEGALYQKNTRNDARSWNGASAGGVVMLNTIVLNASLSNALYGAAERVQPKGLVLKFCIIYE